MPDTRPLKRIAQLVEREIPNLEVKGSSPFALDTASTTRTGTPSGTVVPSPHLLSLPSLDVMPQLDLLSWLSQYFWTVAVLFAIVWTSYKYHTPRVARAATLRQHVLAGRRDTPQ